MLSVVALLAVGVAARRTGVLPDGAAKVLDAVVIRLALPGLVISVISDASLDAEALVPVGVAWTVIVGSAVVVALVSWLLRLDRITTGTLMVVVPLGNTSFMGFPAVMALLGEAHLPFAVLYDQLGSFLAVALVAPIVAGHFAGNGDTGFRAMMRRMVTFPPFVALVVAVALAASGGSLWGPIGDTAALLGATVTPLAMIAIGARLDLAAASQRPGVVAIGLVVAMVLAPAAVLGVTLAAGLDGLAWEASVLEAGMPPMVTAAVVATAAGLDERLATALVGIGAVVALVTLPLLALVLGVI